MATGITVKNIIEYYAHANEHYPISDLFMYKYQQKDTGYRELEAQFRGITKIDKDKDKHFFESPLVKSMLEYTPTRYLLVPQSGMCNPSQKWHLLISYYLYTEIVGNSITEIEKFVPMDWTYKNGKGDCKYDCPELCLWMVEAAMDGVEIRIEDVYELFYKAVDFKYIASGHWKNYKWWEENRKEYWNKITKVIEKSLKA